MTELSGTIRIDGGGNIGYSGSKERGLAGDYVLL